MNGKAPAVFSKKKTSSHSALETISGEGTTNAATWGQDGSYAAPTEYPPNMLLYAEYTQVGISTTPTPSTGKA
jgi:hypothetical protein